MSGSDRPIVVVATIDDSYALPLLVALRSACRRLSPGWRLDACIIGHKISEESRARLRSGLDGLPIQVTWETLDLSLIGDYWPGIRGEGDLTAYYRLFLAEVLPESVERVIFLDADILVEGDLAELWNLPFDGHVVQAVPDAHVSLFHLPRLSRVAFTEDVRFTGETSYFNAGVLLIDLRRWREENVGKRAVSFLWKYGAELRGRDQDALNCSLAGRWKPLPPAWNFHELPQFLSRWECGRASPAEMRRAFRSPDNIHFSGKKPWGGKRWQMFHDRWWSVAREIMNPAERLPVLKRLTHLLFKRPHVRLHWRFWHNIIHAPDPAQWPRILALLLIFPWMLVTYPLWRAWVWRTGAEQ